MPGVPLGITLPVVGITAGPDYATLIRAAFETLIADIEAKVTPSEIDINADLDFTSGATSYSAVNIARVALESQASALAGSNPRSVYSTGGELYYQDAAGNNVQLTSSGAVNTASTGAINTTGVPAYGDSGTEVLWSGPDLEYRFKDGSGADDLADIVVGSIEIGNGANRTTIGTAVTSDYSITYPVGAAAGNDSLMEISTAGAVTFVRDIDIDTVDTTGDVSVGAELTVTDGCEADDLYYTGLKDVHYYAHDANCSTEATAAVVKPNMTNAFGMAWSAGSGVNMGEIAWPLKLDVGVDISRIEVYYWSTTTLGTWQVNFIKYEPASGTYTQVSNDTWAAQASSDSSPDVHVWTEAQSIVAESQYFITVEPQTVSTSSRGLIGLIVTTVRPNS